MTPADVERGRLAAKVHNLEPLVPAAKRARRRLVSAKARLDAWWNADEPDGLEISDAAFHVKAAIRDLNQALEPFDT